MRVKELVYFSWILQWLNFSKIGIWCCSYGFRWFMIWSYKIIVIYFNRVNIRRKQESFLRLLVEFVSPLNLPYFSSSLIYISSRCFSINFWAIFICLSKNSTTKNYKLLLIWVTNMHIYRGVWDFRRLGAMIKQYIIHYYIDEDK